jgi:hypothetical protein
MSKENRKNNYKKLIYNNKINTIIVTNAFSAKLNISTIKYVIYKFDNLISLINANQEDNRTKQDNNSTSYIYFVSSNFSNNYQI